MCPGILWWGWVYAHAPEARTFKNPTYLCDLLPLWSYICECSLMKCHELINATWRVCSCRPILWCVSLWALQLSLDYHQVTVPVLFTNSKDTEWEWWRGLCWGIVVACVSLGSAERKLKWWLHKRTNGLQFLPAVPWAVNSRTASVWLACYASYPLFVQDKPMNSMCTLNWEDPRVEDDVS